MATHFVRNKLFQLLFAFLLFSTKLYSQNLSIEETVNYINETMSDGLYCYYQSDIKNGITLSNDGYIHVTKKDDGIAYTTNSNSLGSKNLGFDFYFDEVFLVKSSDAKTLKFYCKGLFNDNAGKIPSECLTLHTIHPAGLEMNSFCDLKTKNSHIADKLFNAMNYLFSLMETSKQYNNDIDDPFVSKKIVNSISINGKSSSASIPLILSQNSYEVFVNIGNLKRKFVLDSGATDISISKELESELVKLGIIKKESYISSALYRIADGSIITARRFLLPQLTVGQFNIKNITISVGASNTPLLLGKSFFDCFTKCIINNSTKTLDLVK